MELFQLIVTEGVYLLNWHWLSFVQVDSQVDTCLVGWYCPFFCFFELIQQVMIFLGNCVPNVLVFLVFFVFYCQLYAKVDSFQLNFVVGLISSWDTCHLSSSVELYEGSCGHFVDFHLWFGVLALDTLVHGGIGASKPLVPFCGIVQPGYFL